ncbi:MAG: proline dehydrogenase family protein, partial [Bacteroidia bacterium]
KNTINVEDLKVAFKYKSNSELKYTFYIFKILQYPRLLKILMSLTTGILKYNLPLKFLIKGTVFKIFCAGESINDAFTQIKKLDTYKVKSVLDYVSEGEKTDRAFKQNAEIIITNINKLGKEAPGNYVSVKISGLEDPDFLKKINNSVFPTDILYAQRFEKLLERINLICKAASENHVVVFIDAEDRYMQDILDAITEHMMQKYNHQHAVVFNTLQMYLKDRPKYIKRLIEDAETKKYIPGIKLVRGAYVEKERETAKEENKESPVYDTKEQTDNAFNEAVEVCLSRYPKISTCVASHNDTSTTHAVACMKKYNLENNTVKFSQLLGMSDNLTFNLAANEYNTSKYLPYGEVKKAIPYLIRRSEENSSINGQISREVMRLKIEIERRKSSN